MREWFPQTHFITRSETRAACGNSAKTPLTNVRGSVDSVPYRAGPRGHPSGSGFCHRLLGRGKAHEGIVAARQAPSPKPAPAASPAATACGLVRLAGAAGSRWAACAGPARRTIVLL